MRFSCLQNCRLLMIFAVEVENRKEEFLRTQIFILEGHVKCQR